MRTLGFGLEERGQPGHQYVQIERCPLYHDFPRLDLPKIEQVVDERPKLARGCEQPVDQLPFLLGQALGSKHFRGTHDAIERGSHFVAHRGEKLALGLACRLRLRARALRFGASAFDALTLRFRLRALHLHPGFFRGLLDCRASRVTDEMKITAANAIASVVSKKELHEEYVIPSVFNKKVAPAVAREVVRAAQRGGLARRRRRPAH